MSDKNLPLELPYHTYVFAHAQVADLTDALLLARSAEPWLPDDRSYLAIQPEALAIAAGTFSRPTLQHDSPAIIVAQEYGNLRVACPCGAPRATLCQHQVQVLRALLHRKELRAFFDAALRRQLLVAAAQPFGLAQETDLDAFFTLNYRQQKLEITPKLAGLYALTTGTQLQLAEALLPPPTAASPAPLRQRLLVLGKHKYYDYLTAHLFEAALTATGKPKNPLTWIAPLAAGLATDELEANRFYTSVAQLQQAERTTKATTEALRALLRNPLGLPIFTSETAISEKETAASLVPLVLDAAPVEVRVEVEPQGLFYAVSVKVLLGNAEHDLRTLPLKYSTFLASTPGVWHLVAQPEVLRVLAFFKARQNLLLLHKSQFPAFQTGILTPLAQRVAIHYADLLPATPRQIEAHGFAEPPEKLLYLSDSGDFVDVIPVMKYGAVEVPVLSRQPIYATDPRTGRPFSVPRQATAELQFTALLIRQYPAFEEQLYDGALYLPRQKLLDDDWFLETFDVWQQHGITVLGFNKLQNNKLNPHKAVVSVRVGTETNWFDTELQIRYGSQRASLASIHQALRQQRRYVVLGDGTHGVLPQEWLTRFGRYFALGEVVGDRLRTPKISFAAVSAEYEPADFTPATRTELAQYQAQVAGFAGIEPVAPPAELRGTLRPYQQHGLNWLHFLDKFNFGGCLADDMGLGKTIMVLAFLLGQRARAGGAASLVVVPTSLVFNWQAEVEKFAPALRLLTVHGPDRPRTIADFANYDVVLTTYGTLLTDISHLTAYQFHYIFLDESQAIKNPESQRYHAARRLQARNRVVLTGTPIENNTYDLYGQLSFACPGLLGSQQHFRDQFAGPIDKFKSADHARALQRRIDPFVLRRTKQQVATELPAKTEVVLRCEMDDAQRQVYDFYRQEYRAKLMGTHPDQLPKQRFHILQGLTKLRQICDSPALLPDEADYGTASAKLRVLLREIEQRAPQHKILVFSQFVGMLDLIRPELAARGIPSITLTGQTRNRAAAVASFQDDAAIRVFLISLKAGGTGLNLTAADYVYLVDPWWNPAAENQAIDRAHRLGQAKPVVAVRLICPDTIEEKIGQLQARKTELAADLIQTDATILKSLSNAELLELFS